jgi:hypothetical protein
MSSLVIFSPIGVNRPSSMIAHSASEAAVAEGAAEGQVAGLVMTSSRGSRVAVDLEGETKRVTARDRAVLAGRPVGVSPHVASPGRRERRSPEQLGRLLRVIPGHAAPNRQDR